MRAILTHHDGRVFELIGDQAVTKGGIFLPDRSDLVDHMRITPITLTYRVHTPGAIALPGKPQHPAGQRNRDPLEREIAQ